MKFGVGEAELFGDAARIGGVDEGRDTLAAACTLQAVHLLKDPLVGLGGESVEVLAAVVAELAQLFFGALQRLVSTVLPSLIPIG